MLRKCGKPHPYVLFLVEIALHGMAFLKALALISAGVLLSEAWDEPLDAFLEDELFADLAAEDLAHGGALNLLQATAKLHHRGKDGSIPELSEGGGSLASLAAAMEDGSAESIEVPMMSLMQASAKEGVKKVQSSRKVLLNSKQEL
ncbi:unnamed protein product [Effrenium voratum]|nr:unnamed protein product [Effrenium voratum]